MKNQTRIERKNNTDARDAQRWGEIIQRKIDFVLEHGSKRDTRKLDSVINLVYRVALSSPDVRSAFARFSKRVKSRPFLGAYSELVKCYPSFADDRAALKMIGESLRARECAI